MDDSQLSNTKLSGWGQLLQTLGNNTSINTLSRKPQKNNHCIG